MAINGNHRPSLRSQRARVSEWKLKEQMCDIGRRIWIKGFCAGNEGNHSYRICPRIASSARRPASARATEAGRYLRRRHEWQADLRQAKTHERDPAAPGDLQSPAGCEGGRSQSSAARDGVRGRGRRSADVHSPRGRSVSRRGEDRAICHAWRQRLGDSILPYVKDSNTILLQNHGVVTYGDDLEQAYYQLEIVDAYARILILAKQVGSIRPLEPNEMKELLELKVASA